MIDHEGPAVVHAMRDLTVRVFEHIEIISDMHADKSIKYMKHILIKTALKKHKQVLERCKESAMGIAGDQYNLVANKDVPMEKFWTW